MSTARLYALTCGWLGGRLKDMIEGEDGPVRLPIPSYLIEHPKGRALFDTGMHPQCREAPAARLGERVGRLFDFSGYGAGDSVAERLMAADRDPGRIDFVVNSHLHFDHAGGNALVPNATLVVQRREWDAGRDADLAARVGIYRADIDHGHKVLAVEGEHDLFGDGSVVCVPTYGHTPGHQSLKVRTERGEVVLTGDACYFCRTLRERRLPRFVFDREEMLRSLDRLTALERGGARLFFGHDADFWKGVPQAPAPAF
ncbi:MAG: N-acyl homoserine lactonase family protein [Alphaproteobacteria bacterium]|nr:N-acyl homoserine lactonase family protein [Alphaproteobacteria bacterium]